MARLEGRDGRRRRRKAAGGVAAALSSESLVAPGAPAPAPWARPWAPWRGGALRERSEGGGRSLTVERALSAAWAVWACGDVEEVQVKRWEQGNERCRRQRRREMRRAAATATDGGKFRSTSARWLDFIDEEPPSQYQLAACKCAHSIQLRAQRQQHSCVADRMPPRLAPCPPLAERSCTPTAAPTLTHTAMQLDCFQAPQSILLGSRAGGRMGLQQQGGGQAAGGGPPVEAALCASWRAAGARCRPLGAMAYAPGPASGQGGRTGRAVWAGHATHGARRA